MVQLTHQSDAFRLHSSQADNFQLEIQDIHMVVERLKLKDQIYLGLTANMLRGVSIDYEYRRIKVLGPFIIPKDSLQFTRKVTSGQQPSMLLAAMHSKTSIEGDMKTNPLFCLHNDLNWAQFKTHHRCEAICKHCLKEGGDCVLTEWQKCADCRRFFPSVTCFDRHKILQGKQKKVVCQQMKVCIVCSHYVYGDSKHNCGQTKCASCKQFDDPEQHQLKCYMQPIVNDGEEEETGAKRRRGDKGAKGYIFFDFESRQDEQLDDGSFKHRVNYCVVQKACLTCHDTWAPDDSCYTCGKRQLVFEGDDTTELFCKWLLTPEHIDYLVFAHNLGGYDGQFILEYAVRNAMKPQIIPRGLSLMALTIQGIRFLDSFSFLPMGLAALPKVFGFDGDVLKGYFPHLFNTVENQQYVGPYPEPKFYMADGMKPEKRSKFMEWHNKQKGKEFNFKKEMENYCTDDVNILRRAVLSFREIFYNNCNTLGREVYCHGSQR